MSYSRSRTGCFTCREDGYKCDEERPFCRRCVRLGKVCKGYGVRLKWRVFGTPSSPSSSKTPHEPHALTQPIQLYKDESGDRQVARRRKRTRVAQMPHPAATAAAVAAARETSGWFIAAALSPSGMPPDVEPECRRLLHYWTVHLAALVSMAPVCQSRGSRRGSNSSSRASMGSRRGSASSSVSAYSFQTNSDSSTSTCPFLLHLTPMLPQSAALRSAISSMAASHLAVRRQDKSAALMACELKLQAVSLLRDSLQGSSNSRSSDNNDNNDTDRNFLTNSNSSKTDLPSLATILMLQLSDKLFLTADSRVVDHLAGAKALIGRGGGLARWTATAESDGRFLLGLLAYHDILGSIARGCRPLFDWGGSDSNATRDSSDQDIMQGRSKEDARDSASYDDSHGVFSSPMVPIEGLECMRSLTSILRIVGAISKMNGRPPQDNGETARGFEQALLDVPASEDDGGDDGDDGGGNTVYDYPTDGLESLAHQEDGGGESSSVKLHSSPEQMISPNQGGVESSPRFSFSPVSASSPSASLSSFSTPLLSSPVFSSSPSALPSSNYASAQSPVFSTFSTSSASPARSPTSNNSSSAIYHTTEAYRHAALIYLYRTCYKHSAPPPVHTDRCLFHVARVPLASPLVSAHILPLWTAGCEATDAHQRDFVQTRIDVLYRLRQLPALSRLQTDMKAVWQVKDAQRVALGGDGVDRVDCIQVIWSSRDREADLV